MPHEVFICYASPDKAVAEAVCDALESRQIGCWIAPRDVLPGMEWAETIVDAIDSSRALVLVLSTNSNISPQVIREVGRAAGKGIPIIPLRIDDVSLSKAMDYFISRHHWLDAQTGVQEKHLKRLTDTVQQILSQKGAPPTGVEKAEAEEKAKKEAEEARRAKEAEEKAKREEEARKAEEAEEKARKEAEERAKREAELAAKEKARREAEEAKERKRKEAEKAAKAKAKKEAEEAKKAEKAWEKALKEAEKTAKEKTRREAEEARKAKEAEKAKAKRPEPVKVGKPLVKQWWLWAGAAVVAAAIPLIVILSGGGGEEPPPVGEPPPGETEEVPPDGGVVAPPAKESIVIGAARPISGANAFFEESAFGPIYKMWVDEVNAAGGIYVEEYGKSLPIELKIYDDESDIDTMTRLLEKLIVEDEVDFVLSPATEVFAYAAAPIFNEHGYILLAMEGSMRLKDMLPGLPYCFSVLNFADYNQVPVMADIFAELGVETVAIVLIDDWWGEEYSGTAVTELARRGIDVVMIDSVPMDVSDFSLILLEAQDSGADALCCFAYPPQTFPLTPQAMAMHINFDVFLLGPGVSFGFFPVLYLPDFSTDFAQGVMALGAWSAKSSPAAAEFCDKYIARYGDAGIEAWGTEDAMLDYWGHLLYWAGLEFFEQAIEEAGTLDQAVIRDIMATSTFDTCLGPTWFESGLLAMECYLGQIGQWQNGVFEVIDPGDNRTAEPIYPKPDWP